MIYLSTGLHKLILGVVGARPSARWGQGNGIAQSDGLAPMEPPDGWALPVNPLEPGITPCRRGEARSLGHLDDTGHCLDLASPLRQISLNQERTCAKLYLAHPGVIVLTRVGAKTTTRVRPRPSIARLHLP